MAERPPAHRRDDLCRRVAIHIELGLFWEALDLPENAPPGQVMAALARLRSRCKELGERINALRFWLVDRRGRPLLTRARALLARPPAKLLDAYGPELRPFLEQQTCEVLDAMRKALLAHAGTHFEELAEKVVGEMVADLSRLRVDAEDERRGLVTGVRHRSGCPVCNGRDEVPCPVCKEHVHAAVREAMKQRRIPSWITPADFVEILGTDAQGGLTCPACGGKGIAPCPNREEVMFALPDRFRDGWIAKSVVPGEDGKYYFVTLQRA